MLMTARMQFVLGPKAVSGFAGWPQWNVGNGLFLVACPDLKVEQASLGSTSATMIGYMLDPCQPDRSDAEILAGVVSGVEEGGDLFEIVYPLGGRWVLLVDDGSTLRLLNDATGLRQVRYSHIGHLGQTWCASQAKHIGMALGLEMDAAAIAFMEWNRARDPESWWPGISSPYREVMRLLPNHYLDMRTGKVHRFWPQQDRSIRELDETAVEDIAKTLSAQILSAALRFQCAQGLSAGWDSRMMLAASRPVIDRLRYYTARKRQMAWSHPDVSVPRKLVKQLDLPHDFIEHKDDATEEFLEVLSGCSSFAHTARFGVPLENGRAFYGMQKVAIVGNVSEVARCSYPRTAGDISAEYLSSVTRMEHPFAVACFEDWLRDAKPLRGYNVLDLFYWEQRIGSWFSKNCLHFDCAWKDVFVPFNNRKLLADMLAIDEDYRKKTASILYLRVMKKLWPEVLSEPINPHKGFSSIKTIKRYVYAGVRLLRGVMKSRRE